jgi:hypothetical protein
LVVVITRSASNIIPHSGDDEEEILLGEEFEFVLKNGHAFYRWVNVDADGDLVCTFVRGTGPTGEGSRLQ